LNIKLFFQMKFQEIAVPFEQELHEKRTFQLHSRNGFILCSSASLQEKLKACFDTEKLLLVPLLPQCTKLAMQLIVRYAKWVSEGAEARLSELESTLNRSEDSKKQVVTPAEEPWKSFSITEFLYPLKDISSLTSWINTVLFPEIEKNCKDMFYFEEVSRNSFAKIKECILGASKMLNGAQEKCETLCVSATSKVCSASLQSMYNVMSVIRSKKDTGSSSTGAVSPSSYATTVFEPMALLAKSARDGSNPVSEEKVNSWSSRVCCDVLSKCTEICAELVVSAHQAAAMLSQMGGEGTNSGKSEAQMFVEQLTADVNCIGEQAQKLGLDLQSSLEYQRLLKCLRVM